MLRYLVGILEKEEKRELVKLSVLMLISPIFDLFSFSVILYILNTAIQQNRASLELIFFSGCMGGASLIKGFFELYKCYIQNRFINFSAQRISVKIFELFEKEDLQEHNKKSPMQALAIVREDTANCMSVLSGSVSLLISSFTLAVFCGCLIWISRALGIAVCLGMIGFMAMMYLQNRLRMMRFGEERRQCIIKSSAQITTAFGMFKETKIDSRADVLMNRYEKVSRNYADIQSRYAYKTRIISVMMQNFVMAALFFVLTAVMCAEINLSKLLAPAVVCMTLLLRMLPMAVEVVTQLANVEFARRSYEAVRDSLERYEAMKSRELEKRKRRKKQITVRRGISVRNLTFGYRENNKIFEDASVEIPAGKTIAIIGPSGSGKTTFLDLILGLLKPEGGSIWYDDYEIVSGRDPQGECAADLGDAVSYIPQTVYLNGETICNNVAFFETEDTIDEDRVCKCLQYAQVWEEVAQMPQGIDTLIGENGMIISGGQR